MGDKTARDVIAALEVRYPPPAWAFIPQVRDGTGAGVGRTADAIAMSLWPSRGMEVIGFEIKTHRTDWLRELREPAKAESIFGYCDRWYVVVTDAAIVVAGELPPTWGLMVLDGTGISAEREAPKLTPGPLDRAFIAAILRRAHGLRADKKEIDDAVRKALENRKAQRQYEFERLRESVKEFEERSGVKLDTWRAGDIGEAVRFALEGGIAGVRRELGLLRERALSIAERLSDFADDNRVDGGRG